MAVPEVLVPAPRSFPALSCNSRYPAQRQRRDDVAVVCHDPTIGIPDREGERPPAFLGRRGRTEVAGLDREPHLLTGHIALTVRADRYVEAVARSPRRSGSVGTAEISSRRLAVKGRRGGRGLPSRPHDRTEQQLRRRRPSFLLHEARPALASQSITPPAFTRLGFSPVRQDPAQWRPRRCPVLASGLPAGGHGFCRR